MHEICRCRCQRCTMASMQIFGETEIWLRQLYANCACFANDEGLWHPDEGRVRQWRSPRDSRPFLHQTIATFIANTPYEQSRSRSPSRSVYARQESRWMRRKSLYIIPERTYSDLWTVIFETDNDLHNSMLQPRNKSPSREPHRKQITRRLSSLGLFLSIFT